jgi:pyruvate dehydrogenase E2 component (dihydrolipoamide acetyltransferase)
MDFRMPDPGEGLTEAEVVNWLVKVGDDITVNQPILEIETAKSLVEIPSPVSGTVSALLVVEGETVPVGSPIITIEERGSAKPAEARHPVLVGYGPRTTELRSRRRPADPASAPSSPKPVEKQSVASVRPLAKPPVRKLAKDLGVDLRSVTPSGPGGVITREDVKAAGQPAVPVEKAGRETRTPIRGVRRATAEAMVASAFTAPHVTTWVTVDVTRSMRMLRRLRRDSRLGGAVSPLLLIIRALLLAVRRHPEINASWDEQAGEIVTKHYVNVGIAAATERGLVVPVIREAHSRSLADLAAELDRLIKAARDGSATPADLQGGTISITNIGVFGVDGGTPILPPGQSAILGVGRITARPWVRKGQIKPRDVLQLTLSFDHRLIDGDLGSRFLADVAALLEHPDLALLWD